MIAPAVAVPTNQRGLVTFRLERQLYALPIASVVKITEMVAVTPLPQVHPAVRGIINWQGVLAPVIDLRRCLGLPDTPLCADTHLILAQAGGYLVGLIVDAVLDVLQLSAQQIIRPADILPIGLAETLLVVEGLAHTPLGMVLLLDLEQLITHSSWNFADISSALAAQAADAAPALDPTVIEPAPERVA